MIKRISHHRLASALTKVAILGSMSLCAGIVAHAQQPISNDKQLSAALRTAKSPEDHHRIADYYREKAEKLLKKEKEERELANYYAAHPSMYGKLYPTPYENHKWRADSYRREADAALLNASRQQQSAGPMESNVR